MVATPTDGEENEANQVKWHPKEYQVISNGIYIEMNSLLNTRKETHANYLRKDYPSKAP